MYSTNVSAKKTASRAVVGSHQLVSCGQLKRVVITVIHKLHMAGALVECEVKHPSRYLVSGIRIQRGFPNRDADMRVPKIMGFCMSSPCGSIRVVVWHYPTRSNFTFPTG